MKLHKILTACAVLLSAVILLFAGMLFGIQNEKNKLVEQEQAQTITDIAIVNLDEGVPGKTGRVYYSTDLMRLDNDSFILENLEAAREGITNGSYAAYVILPAQFSKDVESINGVPSKATLEYAINPNLREDVSRLTIENIKNFEISLNTNLSYLYVQAILSEFHQVQDGAAAIMNHDNTELQRILTIDPEALTAELVIEQAEPPEEKIEEIDFAEELSKSREVTEGLHTSYDDFAKQGQNAFLELKGEETGVMEGVDSFLQAIAEIDVEKDEEGVLVYEAGEKELDEFLNEYNNRFAAKKAEIVEMVDGEAQDAQDGGAAETAESVPGEEALAPLLKTILSQYTSSVNSIISGVNENNADQKQKILQKTDALLTKVENGEAISSEELESLKTQAEGIQTVETVSEDNLNIGAPITTGFQSLMSEIDSLPQMAITPYEIIVKEKILQPLKDEVTKENERAAAESQVYTELVTGYMEELGAFDVYEYYDEDKIAGLLDEFSNNMELLEEKVYLNRENSADYVADTLSYTDETIEQIQNGLKNSYETTESNVKEQVQTAQNIRESMNQDNVALLQGFTEKLPYTRVGKLEYVQAYDFIVKPVQMSDVSVTRKGTGSLQNTHFLTNMLVVLGILLGLCIAGSFLTDLPHTGGVVKYHKGKSSRNAF